MSEVYLYLMATPCAACGQGPLTGPDRLDQVRRADPALIVRLDATCAVCNRAWPMRFRLPHGPGVDGDSGIAAVNLTDEPSRIIDVAQWLMLFRIIVDRAGRESDKAVSRRLGLEAAQCLEEALKFYDADNDLPPSSALFSEEARRRLADHPQDFSRQRLIEMRAKLPTLSAMRARALADATAAAAASPSRKRPAWWKRLIRGQG
ncbi:MAG: hypothetical protein C4547_07370 [Phycisphaerales bacterium]|nr:MAG: hypothetical protein C4547_07370 [Phycisphaerales bacterium]